MSRRSMMTVKMLIVMLRMMMLMMVMMRRCVVMLGEPWRGNLEWVEILRSSLPVDDTPRDCWI